MSETKSPKEPVLPAFQNRFSSEGPQGTEDPFAHSDAIGFHLHIHRVQDAEQRLHVADLHLHHLLHQAEAVLVDHPGVDLTLCGQGISLAVSTKTGFQIDLRIRTHELLIPAHVVEVGAFISRLSSRCPSGSC